MQTIDIRLEDLLERDCVQTILFCYNSLQNTGASDLTCEQFNVMLMWSLPQRTLKIHDEHLKITVLTAFWKNLVIIKSKV